MQPLYIGQNALIRGYDPADFRVEECSTVAGSDECPEFARLNGSRIGVASVEFRIPLFGTKQLGIFNVPFLPLELSPFFDAGVAWRQGSSPQLRFDQNTTDRVPVFSTGITARANVLGYAILELFYAHPFQRPGRGNVFGFQLAPGW
jgi:outer membrane protein assembly factor BamA